MIPKFRVWDKRFSEFVEDFFVSEDGKIYKKTKDTCYGFAISRETSDKIILMQSTGLKDKNGNEIFEGDVVQYQNTKVPSADSKGVIRYFDNWAMFGIDIEYNEPRALFFNGLADHISLEVVGNIYENPELIE
jgi:uncharacterized phage protein (TIGR01671 family)